MDTLNADVVREKADTARLNERIENLEKQLSGLSIRDIGIQADKVAMKRVFPNAMNKPFSIRSLRNLKRFIEDPAKATTDSICPVGAAAAWNQMDDTEKNQIRANLDALLQESPCLLFSIKTLKENWTVASESIDHFRSVEDDTMIDAVELCAKILI